MPDDSQQSVTASSRTRSRITNGRELLPDVDGRSPWARRFRDLIELHTTDLGGVDVLSEAQRSLVRRCATIEVELEYQEARMAELRLADSAPSEKQLDLYSRLAGNLRRLLESVGLERRARNATPSLEEIRERGRRRDGDGHAG